MDRKSGLMWYFFAIAMLYLGAVTVCVFLWPKSITGIGGSNLTLSWGAISLGLVIVYTLSSFTNTTLSERAIVMFLGIPLFEIGPGNLVFVPLGFFKLERVGIDIKELEVPGQPEQIWRFKDENEKELPLGIGRDGKPVEQPMIGGKPKPWVQPVRVIFANVSPAVDKDPLSQSPGKVGDICITEATGGNSDEKESMDPLTNRVTTEVSAVLQWRIYNLVAYRRNFGTVDTAEESASSQLGDISVSVMTSALQVGTLARALANQDLLGKYITLEIRERVGHKIDPYGKTVLCDLGIEIIGLRLKAPVSSRDLNVALQQIPAARAQATADRLLGEGEKERMEMLKELAGTPAADLMLQLERLEALQKTLGNKDKIVIVNGQDPVSSVLGTVAGGKALLNSANLNTTSS